MTWWDSWYWFVSVKANKLCPIVYAYLSSLESEITNRCFHLSVHWREYVFLTSLRGTVATVYSRTEFTRFDPSAVKNREGTAIFTSSGFLLVLYIRRCILSHLSVHEVSLIKTIYIQSCSSYTPFREYFKSADVLYIDVSVARDLYVDNPGTPASRTTWTPQQTPQHDSGLSVVWLDRPSPLD